MENHINMNNEEVVKAILTITPQEQMKAYVNYMKNLEYQKKYRDRNREKYREQQREKARKKYQETAGKQRAVQRRLYYMRVYGVQTKEEVEEIKQKRKREDLTTKYTRIRKEADAWKSWKSQDDFQRICEVQIWWGNS